MSKKFNFIFFITIVGVGIAVLLYALNWSKNIQIGELQDRLQTEQANHQTEVASLQQEIQSLNDKLGERDRAFNQQELENQQVVTQLRADIRKLQEVDPEWKFYVGVFGGCLWFFVIGAENVPYSPDDIQNICNLFTKELHDEDLYHWDEPTYINKELIMGKVPEVY